MSFDRLYEQIFGSCENSCSVEFRSGRELRECLKGNVPNKPGVYVFESSSRKRPVVVYVGKAGTWDQGTGQLSAQGLLKRIPNRHDGITGQKFLERGMKEKGWKSVTIRWAVIPRSRWQLLPAKVEADLLQAFFDKNGNLPEWNKSF